MQAATLEGQEGVKAREQGQEGFQVEVMKNLER